MSTWQKGMEQNPIIKQMPKQHTVDFDASIPSPFIYNENYCDLLYAHGQHC